MNHRSEPEKNIDWSAKLGAWVATKLRLMRLPVREEYGCDETCFQSDWHAMVDGHTGPLVM